MKVDHNHSRWSGASSSLESLRPRIVLSSTATNRSKPEVPTSERAKQQGKILERWADQSDTPTSERARQQRKIFERLVSQQESPTSERARQLPKILEWWASHQAGESRAAAPVERRAHEEELSTLSAVSEPVTARAASLLHEIETSPTHAAYKMGGGEAGDRDFPVEVRASSLIQMWKVIEAEGTVSPNRGGGDHAMGFSPIDDRSENLEDYSWWYSDLAGVGVEREKEQGSVVRRTVVGTERGGRKRSWWFGSHHWLRSRHDVQKLLEKFEDERRKELGCLAERRHVSRCMHRSRMQAFLRYRSLLQHVPDQDLHPQSTAWELDKLQHRIALPFLRQQFSPRPKQDCTAVSTVETKNHMTLYSNYKISKSCDLSGLISRTINHESEVERALDDIQMERYSLASESEDLQEGSEHSNVAWVEASSQDSDIDWVRPTLCLNLHSEQNELLIGKPNNDHGRQNVEAHDMCLTCVSSQRVLEGRHEEIYNDLLETYSDNVEIRELLERRTVSMSLASDFRDKLNQVLLSSLQRQRLGVNSRIDEEKLDPSYNSEFGADYQVASSIMPSSSQTFFSQCNHGFSLVNNPVKMDVVLEMRSDIANIHREMGELRKLLECYVQRNAFQYSVQQDASTVFPGSVWEPAKKGSCCICYEKEIDSLIYRCGHMCTCFKCAHELQCDSGRCPVCNAPIVDVVRAHTEVLIRN